MDEDEATEFGRTFQRFMAVVNDLAESEDGEPVRARLAEHFGRDPRRLPVVTDRFAAFEHVNVQAGLDALLEQPERGHELVGLLGDQHGFMSLADLVQYAHRRGVGLGAVDYASLADGPGSARPCVQAGLYLVRDGGVPVAVLLRGPNEHGRPAVTIEILAAEREHGQRLLAELHRLCVERSVFRNQVISFAAGPFGEDTAGPIAFHHRRRLTRDEVVLPEHTFARIEQHVFDLGAHRDRLRESGQHVKRGLLLHGPPGTGKTLLTRYLIGRLVDHTVVVLTGAALQHISAAAQLARSLQPALVVLEDVDLVATERRPQLGHASPLLFELLNVMDGLDEDADLVFLLTTNRADVLEPALAARPGRVDQAVEIDLPDAECRRRLLQLYGQGMTLRLDDPDTVLARTAGVTASFIKELVRKAALLAADADDGAGRLTVTNQHVGRALDVLLAEDAGLTRALLGIQRAGEADADEDAVSPAEPGPAPAPSPGGWFAYAPLGRTLPGIYHASDPPRM